MVYLVLGVMVYLFIGLMILAGIRERKQGWIIIFVWPYVVYTPEGTDWFYKKIGLK